MKKHIESSICADTPSIEAQYKTSIWKNAIIPHLEAQYKTSIWKMQLYPIWKHNIKPEYSFQQIEPTGKSSDVLNTQWHFFKKCPGV